MKPQKTHLDETIDTVVAGMCKCGWDDTPVRRYIETLVYGRCPTNLWCFATEPLQALGPKVLAVVHRERDKRKKHANNLRLNKRWPNVFQEMPVRTEHDVKMDLVKKIIETMGEVIDLRVNDVINRRDGSDEADPDHLRSAESKLVELLMWFELAKS